MTTLRRPSLASSLLLVFAAVACEDSPEARVGFSVYESPRLDAGMVTIRFSDGSGARAVSGTDFSGGASGRADTREFPTRSAGTLSVDVTVVDGGQTVSEGAVQIPLRDDWRWNVSLFLEDRNPADTCFGCFGSRAFAVAASHREADVDSLWVVWGGNSISNPVVY